MRLRLSGRSSDLSRIQIQQVTDAIRAAAPSAEIVPNFRESLGDRMLDDPLWAMPEKGVFTEDFVEDLQAGRTDLVVHSWKDLPTEPRTGTRVVATLPRADVRDVLLVRRKLWESVKPHSKITILSSSPRRAHNLTPFLAWALPVQNLEIEFVPVRGNVPTRLRKLVEGDHHGLVVAKAALDRLLTSTAPQLALMRNAVRAVLDSCRWVVLPIRENPTGAAQGALAMEISADANTEVAGFVDALNDHTTFAEATREREILRSYGGGCHQKIGVTVLSRAYGNIVSVRGLTDSGEILERFELEANRETPRTSRDRIWPAETADDHAVVREPILATQPISEDALWIARADALPNDWKVDDETIVWAAGPKTWRRLAARGIWINGSAEGLGQQEDPRADVIAGRTISWVTLTHDRAQPKERRLQVATYRVSQNDELPDLSAFTHFFWTSGTQFLDAIERHPQIRDAWHACGPGNTWSTIHDALGNDARLEVWLSQEDWMKDVAK